VGPTAAAAQNLDLAALLGNRFAPDVNFSNVLPPPMVFTRDYNVLSLSLSLSFSLSNYGLI
jgi:hypothetical protein